MGRGRWCNGRIEEQGRGLLWGLTVGLENRKSESKMIRLADGKTASSNRALKDQIVLTPAAARFAITDQELKRFGASRPLDGSEPLEIRAVG